VNERVIRTGESENNLWLSEWEGYSDRSSRKSPAVVRMGGLFGQEQHKITYGSPNERFIRTGAVENHLRLSEWEGNSDRRIRKKPMVVRMGGQFGQEQHKITYGSPNERFIRTGESENNLW
jgi:hypothetical protein